LHCTKPPPGMNPHSGPDGTTNIENFFCTFAETNKEYKKLLNCGDMSLRGVGGVGLTSPQYLTHLPDKAGGGLPRPTSTQSVRGCWVLGFQIPNLEPM
jgi:hypothetical protein